MYYRIVPDLIQRVVLLSFPVLSKWTKIAHAQEALEEKAWGDWTGSWRRVSLIPASISVDHQVAIAPLAVMLIFKSNELSSNEGTYLNQVKMIFLLVA